MTFGYSPHTFNEGIKKMNPLETLLSVMHNHMTADSNEIYVEALRLVQYAIDELNRYEYETDADGEEILKSLSEAVAEYETSLREEDEEEDDDDKERDLSDIDTDEVTSETKETVFNNQTEETHTG